MTELADFCFGVGIGVALGVSMSVFAAACLLWYYARGKGDAV